MWCIADFCLVPVCAPEPSISKYVAAVTRMLEDEPNVKSELQTNGTVLEGEWDDVMRAIKKAHQLVHDSGIVRIQTTIKVSTRTDKKQHFSDKVPSVLTKLGK